MPLTDKACKNAKAGEKPYKLADSQGLYLQVMPTGSKYWRWKYRFVGKEKCLALGVYPEVSLVEARDKKSSNRRLLAEFKDPATARKQQKQAAVVNAATTFELVMREWHEHNKDKWSELHKKYILHRIEMNVLPELGRLPIADIKAIQVLKAMQKIEDRGAHDLAKRCLQYCGQIFRYGFF